MRATITTSVALLATLLLFAVPTSANHTPPPASVTLVGSLQSEAGCPGDWDPGCAATHLDYDATDGVWQKAFSLPADSFEYKAALNNSWDENYGLNATFNGANIPLSLGATTTVKFYYDHATHWITSSKTSVIATAPGDFQSELGCPGDWQPDCLRSWLEDPDGDGTYRFETTAIPAGNYEAKVAINEGWDENYGAGGVQNGPNIPFSVPSNAKVTFTFVASTHVLTIQATQVVPPGNVEWDGLAHDSRDTLYRAPSGAVPAGTPVHLRFRTFHDDVTGVSARFFSVKQNAQKIVPMTRVASDVSCYDPALAARTCDFWQTTLPNATPDVVWYRFIVSDSDDVDYYADDSAALDGGLGAATDDAVDRSYALTVYDQGFTTPKWAREAVVYQIFPDRFANGEKKNDPKTGDARYDDPVLALPWNTLPEGYCRNYADANAATCPWRFDASPPAGGPDKENPRGRDYMGGDLQGVIKKLDYLKKLGIDTIYFNPIFAAKSNHRYDTADYTKVDPALGDLKDFEKLVKEAKKAGIRIVLDGVFNHMSSDSPFFDRYHHYATDGACESLASAWRPWFVFRNSNVPCGAADYEGWFGFDSIPVLQKSNADVQHYFVDGPNSISKLWLDRGAAGWRLDVMGDPSFPNGYWELFREVVKKADKEALIVGELWQKDSTLLRFLTGDRADSTMNYRLRDAIIGLLAPQAFDPKGFGDSGQPTDAATFAKRLASIQEDYAPQAFATLMNLIDSHDTERALWTLTPGAETRAAREQNAANVADGKRRLRLASLLQFTLPGMPTVYYGDEVGVTGDDDPDDRRTYPWADTGGSPDGSLESWYRALAKLRSDLKPLSDGDLRILDAGASVAAYGRRTDKQAALVAVNPTASQQSVEIPVAGYVPDGTTLERKLGAGSVVVANGKVSLTLAPQSAEVLVTKGTVDLVAPDAPAGLAVSSEASHEASVTWQAVPGASSYAVYASPVTGGGYVRAGTTSATSFTLTGLPNAKAAYVVVRALDDAGNESGPSNEVAALPHLTIGWANLQWPPTLTHTISVLNRTDNVYGQVWIDGATSAPGPTETLTAQLGFGPTGSNPAGNDPWTWVDASFNTQAGNNDEFVASLLPEAVGSYDYVYRYSTTGGRDWTYGDLNGLFSGTPANPGHLTVNASGDTTAPATPTGLHVVSASPAGVELAWNAVGGDPSLYGYEVFRDGRQIARVTTAGYVDHAVVEGETYTYAVRSLDTSFNRSQLTDPVSAKAEVREVTLVFNVTVPASTDATGRPVNIAGTLARLVPPRDDWNPGGTALTRVDATHWSITLHALENTQLEYKYALGSWDYVEKDGACGEIANRLLTVSYGAAGTQTVNDTVGNWRNVAPCGN